MWVSVVRQTPRIGLTAVHHDELRNHLDIAAQRSGPAPARIAHRVLATCWPGGLEDRVERMALGWLRQWRPERLGAELPSCSCATGPCAVCN